MPFLLWCPVLTLLPIDIVVKLTSSQPDWKLLMSFSVQCVFSPPRVLPQVRSIILRIVDGRSLVVKVHIEVVLSLPHVVLHSDALVHSDTALSLTLRLTHCPQIRTGHNLAWHFTQFHNQQPHHMTHDSSNIRQAQADTSAHLSDRNAHSDWSSDAPTVWNVPRLLHWAQIPKHEQFTGANLRWHKYVQANLNPLLNYPSMSKINVRQFIIIANGIKSQTSNSSISGSRWAREEPKKRKII